ncbi:zinc finger protein 239-like [Anoplophora glabripennis]|uniref:zinc finger protein 239-like n=1 Tax=Anoplophora glabripennis TaxID=217634 RepID=UPI000874495A|nr:zinc finger protein 239-like [Anoplophora glabripennis]
MCRNFVEAGNTSECLKLIDNELEGNVIYCSMCRDKSNARVLNKTVLYNQEVSDNINSLNTLEEQSVEYCIICNEYVPETDKINHKNQCKLSQDQLESNSSETDNEKLKLSKDNEALCNFCGKMFPRGYRIEEHILTHTPDKPFQCQICHKTFSKNFNLKMHEHTHSGDRPYICSKCGKSYTTSSNLRTHMLSSHSNEKKHVCDICKMTFVYPRYLKLHMRKHTGERPFVCSTCGKKFSKNIHLTIHIRTHTGEKPYCCDICGKGFTTTGGLGYHKKVHHKNSTS